MFVLGVLSLLALPVAAFAFFDVEGSTYQTAIEALLSRGIVEGYGDGTFRPEGTVNRAELLKILVDSRFPGRVPADLRCFKDLEVKTPQWYARTTCSAEELGIVNGYSDGTFRPDQPVNLAEALKMTLRSFQIGVATASGAWYEPYLDAARARGILMSLLQKPGHLLTRGEMASLTYALVLDHETPSGHPEKPTGTCGNGIVEGGEQCDDGNTVDGDGCSSICILVPEPVRIATLQIDQQTTGSLQTIARGQTAVPLLKFTAVAGRQDAVLSAITLKPSVGSLLYAQHYRLAMDRDGDGVYDTIVQAEGKVTNDRLIFNDFFGGGVALPKGLVVPFVVRADLISTLGPVSLGVQFATDQPDFVEAQGAVDNLQLEGVETNGVCTAPNCFIRVNTVGSTDINVQPRGNLYVTQDLLPVRSHILLAGSTSDELLRLRLHADSESVDLKTIRIDGVPSTFDSLLLYKLSPGQAIGGTSPVAQASHGQCPEQTATRFCANLSLSTIAVSPSSDVVLAVAARLKNDQMGAVSGQLATLSISSDTSNPAFEARGVQSQQELAQNDGDALSKGEVFIGTLTPAPNAQILGKTDDIALADISSVSADGPSADKPVPSGFQPIGSFRITTLPHTNTFQGSNAVLIKRFTFHVTAENVQLDPLSFKLTLKSDPAPQLPCSASGNTGSFDVTCTGLHGVIEDRIEQGDFAVYRLSANVTNTQIKNGTSTLSVALPILGQRNQTNSISWSDEATVFPWVDIPQTNVDGTAYRN